MRSIFALVGLLWCASANAGIPLLPAFPGAEGAAKYVTGGRGTPGNPGDVYVVTTLDDYDHDDDPISGTSDPNPYDAIEPSIPGSLRYGILTAPPQGRTIVFAVGGTIHLHDLLEFEDRSNITIAGQTAPGGGITLAGHGIRIGNTDDDDPDINNIILQHIRVRPGERIYEPENGDQQQYVAQYDPDAIWVARGSNIMLDHITASWGVDETISTTHNSDNVTVQWSTITQGLYDGGHSEGDGHSYGSLINSGTYSYHHNLYGHSKSRNPQPQDAHEDDLELEFINNVIFNPQDRYGSGSGAYKLNYVANVGINGPQNNDTTDFLLRTNNTGALVHEQGNMIDTDRDDGLFDPVLVEGEDFFRPGDAYTPSARHVFPGVPPVPEQSAREAYIQVLSHVGAMNYRDSVDRQLIRTVMNHLNWSIDTQHDVVTGPLNEVGWPTLPAGTAPTDTNSDGVPDAWAAAKGFDPAGVDDGNLLNKVFASSGYTYLEEYIHSLTPNAYALATTQQVTISTADGAGQDAQINENGGLSATSSGVGDANQLNGIWSGTSGNNHQLIVLKFDLSSIELGTVTDATLELTASETITGAHTFRVYGLEHDADGWDWDEASVEFDNMPGVTFNGDSRTLSMNPYTADGDEATPDNPELDVPNLLRLGELQADSMSAGQTASMDNPNLAVFLNLAQYFQGEAYEGLVTLILEQTNNSGANDASFWSKEGNATFAPRLVLDAVPLAVGLPGDFNGDGVVNAVDYAVWRDNLGAADESVLNDNGDGLNGVDAGDFALWKSKLGTTLGSVASAQSPIPEPASWILAILGLLAARRWTPAWS